MDGLAWRMKALTLLTLVFGGAASAQQQLRDVRPGNADVDGTRVRPGTWEVRYVRVANGTEQEVARVRQQLEVVERDGETLLRSVLKFGGPGGNGVDTAVAVRKTLQPRIHRGVRPDGSRLNIDFGDGWVSGRSVKKGEDAVAKRRDLEAPLFDANIFDIVLGSLPLREGLHVRIPTYVFENDDGPTWFEVRVTGLENVTVDGVTAPAWAVEVKSEQGDGTFCIDRDSRQFVKGVFTGKDGAELRMTRSSAHSSNE